MLAHGLLGYSELALGVNVTWPDVKPSHRYYPEVRTFPITTHTKLYTYILYNLSTKQVSSCRHLHHSSYEHPSAYQPLRFHSFYPRK